MKDMELTENIEPIENIELIEKITLKIVRTGTDKTNFKILEMVNNDGTNINKLMEETKLTKVPINVRVNKLERVGLVKRWRGTGLIVITELGKKIIEMINDSTVSRKIEETVKSAIIRHYNEIVQ